MRPIDAGCEPGEMAPGAHNVVLRAVCADGIPTRLHGVRRKLLLPVQFVLRGRWPTASASEPRIADAAIGGPGRRVSRTRRRRDAALAARAAEPGRRTGRT